MMVVIDIKSLIPNALAAFNCPSGKERIAPRKICD
jgi:hypothetical protein